MSMTPTQIANLLTQRWHSEMALLANEEPVLVSEFFDASEGVTKGINGQLNLRKIGIATAQQLAAGDAGTSGTYNTFSDEVIALTPTFDYSGVEIQLGALSRIDSDPKLKAAYRKQMLASLGTAFDVAGGVLANGLSTNVSGGGGVNLDQSLFLDAWNKLIVSSKDMFQVGTTKATLVLYNKQCKYIMNIPAFTQAQIRGDGVGPVVRGWVNSAMNCRILESGNVYAAAGVAHSPLFLPMAFAKAFNLRPTMLSPQEDHLVIRFIAVQERGVAEYFDEYAADIQTSDS
jgi:hypothetical protein